MPALAQDQDEDTNKWLIAQNQNDPFGGLSPLAPIPRGTVQSPQPHVPVQPVATDTGATEDNTEDEDKIADSHPGHTADDLAGYVKGQEAQVDKYGPDQEKQVLDSIMRERGSLGNRAGNALSGFADAVMQAGGGNSDFAKQRAERENRGEDLRLNAPIQEQEMNAKNMAAKQTLEGQTASTPLGASQAAGPAGLLAAMGVPKPEIAKIVQNPAAARSIVEPWTQMMGAKEKIQVEMILKQLELSQQQAALSANVANQQAERKIAGQEESMKENQEASKHWITHPILASQARTKLAGGDESDTPSISSQQELDSLPVGAKYIFNGQPHTKRKQ